MRFLLICFLCFFKLNAIFSQTADSKLKLFFEKVYLHTDREHYLAGEDIWFKAYLVNAQTNQLFNTSNNLYVELISPDAKIIERKVIHLDKGLGNGDFKLNDSITTGTYRLRAYTNWMRNFGNNFIFEKSLNLYGNNENIANVNLVQEKTGKLKNPPPVNNSLPSITSLPPPFVRFFPEGGSLVEEISGIVAFKAQDEQDKAVIVKGIVTNAAGEEVSTFSSDAEGMGMFLLAPAAGQKYMAKGKLSNGETFSLQLPEAFLKGFSLKAQNADSIIRITISTNQATLEDNKGKPITLLLKSRGKTYYTTTVQLHNLQAVLSISKINFPTGISTITLYDESGRPQCERLFYHERGDKAVINMSSDKSSYPSKGKVTLSIKTTDQNNNPLKSNLSLSVTDANMVAETSLNIVSYLNLLSDVGGKIENLNQYIDDKNPASKKKLDLLLLTQGWRDFIWKKLADSALRIDYLPEQGITVSGTVKQAYGNKPVPGTTITLSASENKGKDKIISTQTDSAGKFYIDGLEFYGDQLLKLARYNNTGKNARINPDSLFSKGPSITAPDPSLTDSIDMNMPSSFKNKLLERRKTITQSLADTVRLNEVTIKKSIYIWLDNEVFTTFGYKDEVFEITPKDYEYKTVRQYITRYSPSAPSQDAIGFFYWPGPNYPRIVVNNKVIPYQYLFETYYDLYYSMSLEEVDKIVIKHLIGPNITDVYVIYLTVKPPKESDRIAMNVRGYYEAREFYAPNYETTNNKPDLRTTIHWEPNIITNDQGEATLTFYNADPKTKIRLVVEGITENGLPITGTAAYEVK